MAKQYAMTAEKRERAGKGVARALRREDKVPAVIYGDNKAPITIAMSAKDANVEYNKGQMFTTLCELDVDGEKNIVLARDVQLHPVKDNVLHIDFLRVSDKTTITVAVPVNYTNQDSAKYTQEKGVLNIVRFDVEVVCKAKNIPDEIVVDLADFEIGDSVKISNADMPDGAKPAIDDRDFTLATISAPRAIIEEEPEAEEGAEGEEGAEAAEGEGGEGAAKAEGGEGDAPAEEKKD
ncbi:MAG: 50S ribosomal protein L25/general stress protein Ctc [Pseudomonadota bacterium]